MTELELYRFLQQNEIEFSWRGEMLLAWISHWNLSDFTEMIPGTLEEGGIDVRLQSHGNICIDLVPVCDHYGIDPERILKPEN